MTWEEWLSERPLAVIATTGVDGMPHAVPVELVVAYEVVWSWCSASAARVANIARTGSAAIVAYKGDAFVLVRGPARAVDATGHLYDDVTALFLTKYKRDETYGNDTLIAVTPERVTAERIS